MLLNQDIITFEIIPLIDPNIFKVPTNKKKPENPFKEDYDFYIDIVN
ncbi:MAG: hypothetical protein K0R02_807 [Rickettsiaceae bacterium]|jgi:hypothetical protein|nr:hypothetical protein [Rickettsiaceae bacterium]